MPWVLTDDVERYTRHAWDLLAASPAQHTVSLTVVEFVRAGHRYSDEPMLFGWLEDGGEVRGAVSLTPPFALLLGVVPTDAIADLAATLRSAGVSLTGANGEVETVERFAAAWADGTEQRPRTGMRLSLYELGALTAPDPPPAGRGRVAGAGDLETSVRWLSAFVTETGVQATDVAAGARERMGDGRLWLWEDDAGAAVALAARTPTVAGVARIAPVYTPPEQRRRGYAAAVTAACTADALERGAERVVLFTDLADPSANGVYRRIGFRPLSERHELSFEP